MPATLNQLRRESGSSLQGGSLTDSKMRPLPRPAPWINLPPCLRPTFSASRSHAAGPSFWCWFHCCGGAPVCTLRAPPNPTFCSFYPMIRLGKRWESRAARSRRPTSTGWRRGACSSPSGYNMGSWTGAVCVASRTMFNTGRSLWHCRDLEQALLAYKEKVKEGEKLGPRPDMGTIWRPVDQGRGLSHLLCRQVAHCHS